MAVHAVRTEAISRGARMLRTALGPAITHWLDGPAIIEVMLNPDGRLWIDRLASGLCVYARDRGALRVAAASCRDSTGVCDPQARGCRLHARRIRSSQDHDLQ